LIVEWNHNDGLTVFLTSHDAGDIESVARRVVVINHGRIVLDDKVSNVRRKYMGSKVLSAKFAGGHNEIQLPGLNVLKSTEYALKMEVDTNVLMIESAVNAVLSAGTVSDISIEDPPLEEVIAHIYGQASNAAGEVV